MKLFLGIGLIFLAMNSFAQNSSVEGEVLGNAAKEPLEYASVSLLNATDNSLITGVLSDSKGNFKIEKIKAGNYFLKIQFIGYETKQTPSFILNAGQNLNIGKIEIVPGAKLWKEVSVSTIKLNTLNKIDKQSYRASQFESAKGGSAIDVLKNLPSVAVNGQGEISVRGSTGFLVLINGSAQLSQYNFRLNQWESYKKQPLL
ncbi:MAG TPA: carboxypeptidase regulatory-like domain-containing protein [Hanamia sp.]|nr:carboxypeptidase regulatory-like domain-containing protein [Hanamia sp.]